MKSSSQRTGVRQYNKSELPRLIWSHDLHQQFVGAVQSLGGKDKATPKNILQMMDVKGLKISHIKSHLQMYRNMKEKRHTRALRKVTGNLSKERDLNVNLLDSKFYSRSGICFGFTEGSSQSTEGSELNPDQVLSSNTCISSRTWNEEGDSNETFDACRLSLSFSTSPAPPTLMEERPRAHPCQCHSSEEDYQLAMESSAIINLNGESFRTTHINLDLRI